MPHQQIETIRLPWRSRFAQHSAGWPLEKWSSAALMTFEYPSSLPGLTPPLLRSSSVEDTLRIWPKTFIGMMRFNSIYFFLLSFSLVKLPQHRKKKQLQPNPTNESQPTQSVFFPHIHISLLPHPSLLLRSEG